MLLRFIMQMPKVCSEELVCPIGPIRSPSCSQPRMRPRQGPNFRQPFGYYHGQPCQSQQKGIPRTCNVVHFSLTLEGGLYSLGALSVFFAQTANISF